MKYRETLERVVGMKRRDFLKTVGAAVAAPGLPVAAFAQGAAGFPNKQITMMIAFPAGGSGDLFLRALADVASKVLGQSVIPDNRVGATGTMAAATMSAGSKPDGYTIAQMPVTVFRLPQMQKATFDPLKDFTWIIHLTGFSLGIGCKAESPFKTWKDVVEFAKANPGKVTYGTAGPGSTTHLGMEQIAAHEGVKFTHVPFKGGPDITAAVLGDHVMLQVDSTNFKPMVDAGKMRALNVWGRERFKIWPDVPTLKDLGYPFVWESPYGLAGPKGMDPAVVKVLHDAFKKALDDPGVQSILTKFDKPLIYADGAGYAKMVQEIHDGEKAALERVGLLKKE
jgi:tripartite-type tricarboxylate transporter receptor subunit TctC